MRILYSISIMILFALFSSVIFVYAATGAQLGADSQTLQTNSVSVTQHFYAAAAVPQVYTYVLRPIGGQTENTVEFKADTSSFLSVTTNAPYQVGTITLSHYKLSREPISKFSLAKRTYEYITLESNTTILSTDGVAAKIRFSIDKSWVSNAGGYPEQIALFAFDETWKKLDTKLVSSEGTKYTFDGYANTFGYFAIAIDKPVVSAAAATTNSNDAVSTTTGKTTPTQPQSIDTKTTKPVEVVYPLLDQQQTATASSTGLWQKLVGFGLLIFALTGVIIVGVTVVQSRRHAPTQFKTNGSVNDLLAKLQSSRAQALKTPTYSSDVNALLAKVNARYQPAVSASMPKMQSSFMSNSSSLASTLSHSIDDLKSKVAELEPDIVKRYTDWGISHGHSLDMIKRDLIEHEIDEDLINRVLHGSTKKF